MKYFEVDFTITPNSNDNADILSAYLAELGFETFLYTDNGLQAFVQQRDGLDDDVSNVIKCFPIPNVAISYEIREAENRDWNEDWEKNGYEPIVITNRVCVHDSLHESPVSVLYDILINPRQAFGTGTHATTRTLLSILSDMVISGKKVVDAGCGTGVLGILCCKMGADEVFAYDIDEWSVVNTQENAKHNAINNIQVVEGDSRVLERVNGVDLFIANIFREIIVADMPHFVSTLKPHATILLSGFYESDIPAIVNAAEAYNFKLQKQCICEGWAVLLFER